MPRKIQGENGPCIEFMFDGKPYRSYPPDYTVVYRWVEGSRNGKPRCYETHVGSASKLGRRLRRIVQDMLESGRISA